jgi:sodium-dependent dicarboxylate transporter 2/3/5
MLNSPVNVKTDALTPPVKKKLMWLALGIIVLIASFFAQPAVGLTAASIRSLGVTFATVLWWITEALPIPVTGLLVFPLLHTMGVVPFKLLFAQTFGDPFVPFMIGCLALSVAFTKSGLGKRITYIILSYSGIKVNRILDAFFWIPFAISAFITDLAVVALMYPIALSLAKAAKAEVGKSNFGLCLMFAITFGGVIGGLCTPSGVPSNIITISFLEKNAHLTMGFLEWTIIATPIAIVLGVCSQWLTKKMYKPEIEVLPFGPEVIAKELSNMGPWTQQEKTTLVVFLTAVSLWLTGDFTKLPIAVVSLFIVALLTIPGFSAVKGWRDIESELEWGSLMLMVGGFALGVATFESGLAKWLAQHAIQPLAVLPTYLQPFAITLLVAIDSLGFSSFTAASAVNVPLVIAYAQQNGYPVASLAMAAGLASSTHFILVTESLCFVLTYASGYYTFKDLFKVGCILTVISAIVIALGVLVAGMPMGTPIR